jgi:hypothetical protein
MQTAGYIKAYCCSYRLRTPAGERAKTVYSRDRVLRNSLIVAFRKGMRGGVVIYPRPYNGECPPLFRRTPDLTQRLNVCSILSGCSHVNHLLRECLKSLWGTKYGLLLWLTGICRRPVGTVWIDLSEPTSGIHRTPEPDRIDKSGSHDCFDLTDRDAQEPAKLLSKGVAVEFL